MAKREEDLVMLDGGMSMFDEIELETLIDTYGEEEGRRLFEEYHNDTPIDFTEDMPTDDEMDEELEELISDEVHELENEPELTDEEIKAKYGEE